jgi:UDP-N-acetylmuramoyl-tripeptide--D-alanyl-D-alanine ligase
MKPGNVAGSLVQLRQRAVTWLSHRAVGPMAVVVSAHRATLGRRTKLIAVTGSFGKTTATRAVAAILGEPTDLERVPNAFSRMFFRALRQTSGRPVAVIEVGIGRPNQMRRYARAIRPQIAVVTSVGWEHELYFPDGLEGIRAEKSELVSALPADGFAVLNRDDSNVMWMAQRTKARILTFGRHPDSDVAIVRIEPDAAGTRVTLRVRGVDHALHTSLIGSVAALPIAAAVAATIAAGVDVRQAVRAVESLTPSMRRLEPVRLASGARALLDDTKGTPATALAAFDAVAELPHGRHVAVLGNIPKTTPEPVAPVYRQLGRRAGEVFDRIVFIHLADGPYEMYRQAAIEGGLAPERISRTSSVKEAAEMLRTELRAEDTLLLKGHFTDHLSRIAMQLQGIDVRCRLPSCAIRGPDWCSRCPLVSTDVA